MKVTKKELALHHSANIAAFKRKKTAAVDNMKAIMKLSSRWLMRATADVDFLETEEEIGMYYGALVSSEEKMKNYK